MVRGSSISGHVYGASVSLPLAGACVEAQSDDGGDYYDTHTASDGSYTIGDLPADVAYTMWFQPCRRWLAVCGASITTT